MQVVVNGLMTSYYRTGKGKTVLILPGWADSSASWRDFAAKLSPKYDVIAIDLPGFGGTQTPKESWGLDEFADFVAGFAAKLKLKPYAIIGHSNGGAIAIKGLSTNQLTAQRLVLLASAGVREQNSGRKGALHLVTKAGKAVTRPLPDRVRRRIRGTYYQKIGSDYLVAEHMQESFKKIVNEDVRGNAAKLKLPTLLVYGAKDRATPVRFGELLYQSVKGSTLTVIDDAGHFLHQDKPVEVVELVQGFLK